GAGTLLMFFLLAAAGWSGLMVPGVLWVLLSVGLLLWARPGRFCLPPGPGLISLCGLLVLPLVMLPPASRDAMIHHLYQARLWLDAGRIVRPEWSGFFSYPYLTETLYSLAGGTFGFRISRAVSLLGFLAACSVPAAWFLEKGRRKEAILSLLVLVSIPELLRNASWSYSDSFLVFFSLLAYSEMLKEDGSPLTAVIWGAAAACCKYNGILVLVSVFVLLPVHFRRLPWKTLAVSLGAALFISSWWAVPNLLQWGNPVYPLLRGLLGPENPVSLRAADYFATAPFSTSLHGVLDYLLLPVRMSVHGRWDDPVFFDGASGPLLLAGVIIALPVLRGKRRKFLLPVLYLLLTLIFKGQGVRTRYMLPGFAMLSIPLSEALGTLLCTRGRLVRYATLALLTGCLFWSGSRMAELYSEERPWELPSDTEYLSRKLPEYDFFMDCGGYVSGGDTTFALNIGRVFYYPGYAVFDENGAPLGLVRLFWSGMGSEEIADSLRKLGVTHVAADMFLTSINLPSVLEPAELAHWNEFISLRLVPLLTEGSYALFRLE
ncbi:MAG: hypothetical protein JXR55_08405, partial [Candidatus Fermentibacteraceae bacterium]|nr:hypothetical protein [Candidatus Fermentibacteraceae bacterium]